jgi:hypothetical protein
MHKTPVPNKNNDYDCPACFATEEGPRYDELERCLCWQGLDGKGEWRVRVDRHDVAYTVWESAEMPF